MTERLGPAPDGRVAFAAVRAANPRVNELPDLAERVSGHSRQVPAKQLIHR
jgi:hypothetical protein